MNKRSTYAAWINQISRPNMELLREKKPANSFPSLMALLRMQEDGIGLL